MKIFWQEKNEPDGILATGVQKAFPTLPENPAARIFLASDFSLKRKGTLWEGFPTGLFFIPEEEKRFSMEKELPQKLALPGRTDLPDFSGWKKICEEALFAIEQKRFDKVVLARMTTLTFQEKIDPWKLLARLKNPHTTAFLFELSPEKAFIGFTPEKLYQRQEDQIFTESVAGTRPMGDLFTEELLQSEKERREFTFVKTFIHDQLSPLCTQFAFESEDRILKTGSVQHLYNPGKGILKPHVTDQMLLDTLHPTPAVGGMPRSEALSFQAIEPFDRGWYAGSIGWVSKEAASIAVGIRSALILGKEIHLFAGAGIVAGSLPEKEWEELNHKISHYTGLYDACRMDH